jgi:hypothetical protein
MRAELAHDLGWEIAAGLGRLRLVGHVADADGEVLAETGGWPPGTGQAHGSGRGENLAHLAAGTDAGVGADLPGCLLVGEPVKEELEPVREFV